MVCGFSILSACSSKDLPEQVQPQPVQQTISPTDLPAADPTDIPTALPTKAAVEVEQVVEKPSIKTKLEATDPGSVSLINGRPTFVEFFAFW